jgi:hypothetical protein
LSPEFDRGSVLSGNGIEASDGGIAELPFDVCPLAGDVVFQVLVAIAEHRTKGGHERKAANVLTTERAILASGILNAGCDPLRAIGCHAMAGEVVGELLLGVACDIVERPP